MVGGGIVGICAALALQHTGRNVMLIERDRPAAGASGHNGGVINVGECLPTGTPGVLRSIPRMVVDPRSALVIRYRHLPQLAPWLTRFILASQPGRVESIAAALQMLTDRAMDGYRPLLGETSAGALVQPGGMLTVYGSDGAFAADSFAHALRARRGVNLHVLDGRAIERLEPTLGDRFARGIHTVEPFFTPDPQRFGEALAESFASSGGTLVRKTVLGFERADDRVSSVHTDGGTIRTDSVVIAAGVWSRPLAKELGVRVPLIAERGYGVEIPDAGVTLGLPVVFADHHIGFRSSPSGLVVMGIDELASTAAAPRYAVTERIIKAARQAFPELRTDGATPWMHRRPSLPDSLPVIGRTPRYANAYLAFGHGHKGLGLAGITARLVQELMDGTAPSVNIAPYSPARFSARARLHDPDCCAS